ncbi:dihydrodipicolinate synthase family protein [Mangrovibacterium marinum]|uniref:4-hydroxy-tetrahydrodipicolinate synthase n=1 Tax=Mangrovibacterium marinum TaxID=1639118 RepID=A0A2T5C417_9BACT|nr:dihydrodipicolinate synthase family protein [Mangrovibacterium marinum]PTN09539.1 4-hydroxy-tetrahydrodipicolinate synthase [Mangrovibacterium marinum]
MKKNNPYKGVIVPMISPLKDDLSVDKQAVKKIVSNFLKYDVAPFIAGTTGEASSLSFQQKKDLVEATVEVAKGKAVVYAGISSNCLPESIEMAKCFADMGADVVVANVPSYYPLTDAQAARFCEQLADASPAPLIFYNITATTGYSIPLDLIEKLSYHPNVVGLKDSERDEKRLDQALDLWRDREDFVHLIGWAAMSGYALKNGSDGIVPSTGNFTPKLYADLYANALNGNWQQVEQLQQLTNNLGALYQKGRTLGESLAALKVIMDEQGLCGTQVMPPIYCMENGVEADYRKEVKAFLSNLNL